MISVIVPMFNERGNVSMLLSELRAVLLSRKVSFEIITVDDGSKDGTFEELKREAAGDRSLKVIRFARNFGQTAALSAGISASKGDTIVTIDGDLENDPRDIPRLLGKLDEGFDLVSGWRQNRWQGKFLSRKIPSMAANALISRIAGVRLHDYGCMLKCYRRAVINDVPLYGEMHRFIPAYVHRNGARITEISVSYRPRRYGESKYGIGRTLKVILDLFFIKFMVGYMTKPIHFFGGLGLLSLGLGFLAFLWALILKLLEIKTFVSTPLPIFSALFLIVGVQLIVMGVLAELIMRTYYEAGGRSPHKIRETINL